MLGSCYERLRFIAPPTTSPRRVVRYHRLALVDPSRRLASRPSGPAQSTIAEYGGGSVKVAATSTNVPSPGGTQATARSQSATGYVFAMAPVQHTTQAGSRPFLGLGWGRRLSTRWRSTENFLPSRSTGSGGYPAHWLRRIKTIQPTRQLFLKCYRPTPITALEAIRAIPSRNQPHY